MERKVDCEFLQHAEVVTVDMLQHTESAENSTIDHEGGGVMTPHPLNSHGYQFTLYAPHFTNSNAGEHDVMVVTRAEVTKTSDYSRGCNGTLSDA